LDLAGSKLRSRLSGQLNESASAGITNAFAKRQLEKLGWKEGEGLGKRGNGIKTHIRAVKRADEQGGLGKSSLNAELSKSIGNEWWKSSVGDTLARLSKGKRSKKSSKKSKSSKRSYTDEELFQATGGARFGMRAQAPQKGKWKRTESGKEEEEEIAKTKVEWDGISAPRVVLSASASASASEQPAKKRKLDDDDDDDESAEERKERKQAKKKRRKEEKKQSGEKKKKKIKE
jgi:Pin2-interacting protein X1